MKARIIVYEMESDRMEFLANALLSSFVIGGFVVLGFGIYIGIKPTPVKNTETAPVEIDPFEVEIEWTPTLRKGYLLDHIPTV